MAAALIPALAALLALIAPQAHADDPTRPPAQLLASPRGAAAGDAAVAAASLHLQAVLRTPGRPPGAMINGWVLRPGDTVHGVRLAAVGEQHADVVVGGERVRLSLTPAVTHRAAARPAAPAEPDRGPALPQHTTRGTPK